jgi:hypothetical protein
MDISKIKMDLKKSHPELFNEELKKPVFLKVDKNENREASKGSIYWPGFNPKSKIQANSQLPSEKQPFSSSLNPFQTQKRLNLQDANLTA